MVDDLGALARVAAQFLQRNSADRVGKLASDLRNAIANAKSTGNNAFHWKTADDAPIEVKQSSWWKGNSQNFDPVMAKVHVDYLCRYLIDEDRVAVTGSIEVTIVDVGGGGTKVVHFDTEEGGWQQTTPEGILEARAGHPPFHAQFLGVVNDIPRMPSLIVHPIDVICLALVDLHQKRWRDHIETTKGRTDLRLIPGRQKTRLIALLDRWSTVVQSGGLPIVAMQRRLTNALNL